MAATIFGVPRVARAGEPERGPSERTLHVDYVAEASCPDESVFLAAAKKHTRRWPVLAREAELSARVRASRGKGGFVGELELADATGASLGTRTIEASRCEDAVLALAIFLGVAIDADAEVTSGPSAKPEGVRATPSYERAPPVDERPRRPATSARPSPPRSIAWLASASGQAYFGRAPSVAPGGSVALEARLPARSRFAPSFQLALAAAPYSTKEHGRGHVAFGWAGLVLRACESWTRFRSSAPEGWEPWGCVHAEVGGLFRPRALPFAVINEAESRGRGDLGAAGLSPDVNRPSTRPWTCMPVSG